MSQKPKTTSQAVPTRLEQTPILKEQTTPARRYANPVTISTKREARNEEHAETDEVSHNPEFEMMIKIFREIMLDKSDIRMTRFREHLNRLLGFFQDFDQKYVEGYNATLNARSKTPLSEEKEHQDEAQAQQLLTTQSSTKIDLMKLHNKIKNNNLAGKDLLSVWSDRHRTLKDRSDQFWNLTNGSKFEAWVKSPNSQRLLVIDWFESEHSGRITSMLCWLIYQSAINTVPKAVKALEHLDFRVLPLVYFCCEPSMKNKPEEGALSMYKSLITQLLETRFEFNAKKLNKNAFKLAYKGDIHGLGSLFSALVSQLPEGLLILCMTDGIDYYERQNGGAAFFDYVFHVTHLLQNPESLKATVKLLVTSNPGTPTIKQLTRRDAPFETDQAPLSNRGWHS